MSSKRGSITNTSDTTDPPPDECPASTQSAAPSIVAHFSNLELAYNTPVGEANKRRTASYYEKARQAYNDIDPIVPGVSGPPSHLISLRRREVDRILSYWKRGDQSHRAIVVMCDASTRKVLSEAREMILGPLDYSADVEAERGVWIPEWNMVPEEDMHITVALPWWWHTRREGDQELSREMAARFRQTLLMEFHYPFQIELERFVLLGGKILVALWRCVGERKTEDGTIIYDRHGESVDPFVKLREEIVRCFTTESLDNRLQPITYQSHRSKLTQSSNEKYNSSNKNTTTCNTVLPASQQEEIDRRHTITHKTPGFNTSKNKADGFIHTTLCRLPLQCLSSRDVDLSPIHRLCREASATFGGHRMVVSRYRFLESMGEGGESNPCVNPIFDEYIDAPRRCKVEIDGDVAVEDGMGGVVNSSVGGLQMKENYRATIGPGRNFV
mmetsp:Transcript_26356/g.55005  ORF Transcript_26356/g.55005 Transcript_26356/m.55005 type:complete len:443 (+) Transcript_26356:1-1329(+)